jgi:hypothetical protein
VAAPAGQGERHVSERAGNPYRISGPAIALIAAALTLGLRFWFFLAPYSVNVLFYDQWDLLDSFFDGNPGLAELFFHQHGPHREGLGLIADKYLYPLTRWSVDSESVMIGASIFAAMILAVLLKKRLFGRLAYSDVLIPAIFLTLTQYETVIGTPNPGYSAFPLALLMLYGLALLQGNYLLRYSLVLSINFVLIYTGMGVFAGVVTIGLFLADGYWCWRRALVVPLAAPIGGLFIACASLASFFVHYKFEPAVDCFGAHPRFLDYPWFMAVMFSNFAGIRRPIAWATVVGAAVLLFAASTLVLVIRRANREAEFRKFGVTMAAMLAFSLLFSASTAIGRACLGLPEGAHPSRYTTLLIPAFLAMYFYAVTVQPRTLRFIALALLALFLTRGLVYIHQQTEYSGSPSWYANGKRAWVNCYQGTGDIGYCDSATGFKIHPDAERTRLKQKLDFLKRNKLNLFAD